MDTMDTVVVGAGQSGIAISYFLQQNGNHHVVFEQGRIGESWISQRWDSFRLNTPNFMNVLPGLPYQGTEPNGFWRCSDLIEYFRRYIKHFHLPVRTGVKVISVERSGDDRQFLIRTIPEGRTEESVLCDLL